MGSGELKGPVGGEAYAAKEEAGSSRPSFIARDVRVALGAGVLYLLLVFWQEYIFHWIFGLPSVVPANRFPEYAVTYQFALTALVLPVFAIILASLIRYTDGPLRAALELGRLSPAFAVAVGVVLLSLLLNNTSLWPLTWRSPDNAIVSHVAALYLHGHWFAISILAVRLVVLTPVIEEVFFRVGLLQGIYTSTGSRAAAITVSSLAFGIAHLGHWPFWNSDRIVLVNAFWLLIFSVAIGHITLKRKGRIITALVAHGARNAVELGTLLYAISITTT